MKIKNRDKVDTLPISCIYYTMLIEEPELIILLLSVCKTFRSCINFSEVFHYWNKTAKY